MLQRYSWKKALLALLAVLAGLLSPLFFPHPESRRVWAHPGHGFGGDEFGGLPWNLGSTAVSKAELFADRLRSFVVVSENSELRYIFPMPEKDLLLNLPLDRDKDKAIVQSEFKKGFRRLDNWVREHVDLSSASPNFVWRMLGWRSSCRLRKADYGVVGVLMDERIYQAKLFFQCDSSFDIRVSNGLAEFYRDFSRPSFFRFGISHDGKKREVFSDRSKAVGMRLGDF